jgi:putative transcriptional regulator
VISMKKILQPGTGKILIAEPFMKDPYFKRSVVLLADHDEKGSFGFILNKPVELELNKAVLDFPPYEDSLYMGGPVGTDQLFYIHTMGNQIKDSMEVAKGLWWGGDFKKIKTLIKEQEAGSSQIRFFIGYAGWEAKQLGTEMKEHSWIVALPDIRMIMNPLSGDLWTRAIKSLGGEYTMMANYPEDPQLN